jgi:hypothetical protein
MHKAPPGPPHHPLEHAASCVPVSGTYDHSVLWRGIISYCRLYEALVKPCSVKVAKRVSRACSPCKEYYSKPLPPFQGSYCRRERDLDSWNFLCWHVHIESKRAQLLDQVYQEQRPARLQFSSNSAKFSCMAITRRYNFYVSHHAFCIEPFYGTLEHFLRP